MKGLLISLFAGALTSAYVIGLGYVVCPMDHTANRFLTADSLVQVSNEFNRISYQLTIHQRALDLMVHRRDIKSPEEALRIANNLEQTLQGHEEK